MEERPHEDAKRRPPTSQGEKPQKKSTYQYLDLEALASQRITVSVLLSFLFTLHAFLDTQVRRGIVKPKIQA